MTQQPDSTLDPPMDPPMDPLEYALRWRRAGHHVAVATVLQTWGSAPRAAGSHLAVRDDGEFAGSVSGGCVEGAVLAEALDCMTTGSIKVLEFGVSNDEAWAVGLACGGRIEVLVEAVGSTGMTTQLLEDIAAAKAEKRALCLVSTKSTGAQRLLDPAHALDAAREDIASARQALRRDTFQSRDVPGDTIFFTPINPPVCVMIVGAVHITQALLPLLSTVGLDALVIDPRTAFASAERFAGAPVLHDWPDEAFQRRPITARSAVVTLTHDPKLDDPALSAALTSPAFYIGALGSKRTHAQRRQRLLDAGFTEADVARIAAPVGLDIGASNPAEIALSIAAQILQTLRRSPP
ncbi:MAG: XdhC family protein [Pseudomonadota bacterium]